MTPSPAGDLPGICLRCDEETYVAVWTGPPEDPTSVRVAICPECHEHLRKHPVEREALLARYGRSSNSPT